ncbi:hypothetical protein [Rubritalea tangerina]|uniref:DUF4254 domain-containing protein n=1 Tax=Rubritalea tangerina TaxID=430798 RepID=A0ABW4Z7Z8_9BACT
MKHSNDAIHYLDSLIQACPDQMDTLLDMRLSLMHNDEPGACVAGYFKLKRQLSAWYDSKLNTLRDHLESRIQIEIVIQETQERRNACLALGNNHDLEDYCEDQMRQIALEHKEAQHIRLRFSWA